MKFLIESVTGKRVVRDFNSLKSLESYVKRNQRLIREAKVMETEVFDTTSSDDDFEAYDYKPDNSISSSTNLESFLNELNSIASEQVDTYGSDIPFEVTLKDNVYYLVCKTDEDTFEQEMGQLTNYVRDKGKLPEEHVLVDYMNRMAETMFYGY